MNDFGSSFSAWLPREKPRPKSLHMDHRSASYIDLMQKSKLEEVRREFKLNGYDSPYNPDGAWTTSTQPNLPAAAPSVYLRQRSWPAPDSSPAVRLPRPRSIGDTNFATSTPIFDDVPPFSPEAGGASVSAEQAAREMVSAEQVRVLNSLPDAVVYTLLREMTHERRHKLYKACRFCKNNGERPAFCAMHALKDEGGRVSCPVLRAFVCRRCGASGDSAHTIKYCPLTTNEERNISQGMMRSIRKSSVRRRYPSMAPSVPEYENRELARSVQEDNFLPLEPGWAALVEKLSQFTLDGAINNNMQRHNYVV